MCLKRPAGQYFDGQLDVGWWWWWSSRWWAKKQRRYKQACRRRAIIISRLFTMQLFTTTRQYGHLRDWVAYFSHPGPQKVSALHLDGHHLKWQQQPASPLQKVSSSRWTPTTQIITILYDAVSDLMHNWVAKRPDFRSALRVVKMVLNTQCYQYLWLTMWFHAKNRKKH